MEEKFLAAWAKNREKAAAIGVRMRPVDADGIKNAHRILSSNRESDGVTLLAQQGRLDLSLEALAIDKRFTSLFSDDEANNALDRLLGAGHKF